MLAWDYEAEVNVVIWIMVIASIILLIRDHRNDKKRK